MAKNRSMGWFGGLVYGAIFVVVGCFVVAPMAMGAYRMGQASKFWPTVQGKVIHSAVASSTSSKGKISYFTDIQFTYRVDGRDYKSSQVDVEPGPAASYSSDSSGAYKTVNRYPEGKTVTVYYNAVKPFMSVLQPGVTTMTWWIVGISGFFIFTGVWIALSGAIRALFGIGVWGVLTFAWLKKND